MEFQASSSRFQETALDTRVPEEFDFLKERVGIREFRLRSNGLHVLLLRNTVAPVATFAVVYSVGSRNEAVGHTGATHLLEHLMFKGTPEFNREGGTAVAAVLEALGARFNATTWFDRTNYYETIPSDQIEVAMRIEASRMRGAFIRDRLRAVLGDEDRAPEMTVVRNEYERGENSPFQVLYKETFATAFREHPYHHPTIGWRADIEGVTTARLKEFYDVFYHPNNATGYADAEQLLDLDHVGPTPAERDNEAAEASRHLGKRGCLVHPIWSDIEPGAPADEIGNTVQAEMSGQCDEVLFGASRIPHDHASHWP